ncbi:MAG: hypothetical protein VKK97_13550, partial [Synechococcaceae cyanobacterium]|nr:hypothetical protein [Synechococcaceae cyanobacterium]
PPSVAAPGASVNALAGTQAWDLLNRELASSLPPQEIRAALDELVSSRRHHCQTRQLLLIERLRQQASARAAAGPTPARP